MGDAIDIAALGLKEDLHSAPGDADDALSGVLGAVEELEQVLELSGVLILSVALRAACRLGDPAEVRLVTLEKVVILGQLVLP